MLRRIEPLLPQCGITRVADISRLTYEEFPVFQSTRPSIWGHHSGGQNTGSQGKGATHAQAKVSCIMESIEGFCAEPRQASLYRASYAHLRSHQVVVDPRRFVRMQGAPRLALDEPLMWTDAYSVTLDRPVLVPAEPVFFPFAAADYDTPMHFPCSSNGLASGSTMLEAIIHALYELIERHILALYERGEADPFEVDLSDPDLCSEHVQKFLRDTADTIKASVFLVKVRRREQPVTMAACQMLHGFTLQGADGSGCSSLPIVAIERAFSEAAQALAVNASGAREDMGRHANGNEASAARSAHAKRRQKDLTYWPATHRFTDLREEYQFLVREIRDMGFPDIFIANLTRVGIEIPVVKVLVPEMAVPAELLAKRRVKEPGADLRRSFGIDEGRR